MLYREFGKTGKKVSAVGMGTNRFTPEAVSTPLGIEKCAQLVVQAASLGVNFFDSAVLYSNCKCEEILNIALRLIKNERYVCGKSSNHQQKTRDAVLSYIECSLSNLGIDFFDFYYMWSIKSLGQYKDIMISGGAYAGALAAKERGLIKHICFSTHAPPQDTVSIIKDGAFEGVLLPFSLLNFRQNEIILKAAEQNGLGVAVMNPLGGGIIPQNEKLFKSALMDGDDNAGDAALKFIYAHESVNTVLCGISNVHELSSNVKSLSEKDVNISERRAYIHTHFGAFSKFCTGCGYCRNCPANIDIPMLMKAYNQTLFKLNVFAYNRASSEIVKKGNFFNEIEGRMTFENDNNPCLRCGNCEKICTQSLPVVNRLDEIYHWADENCVSLCAKRNRFEQLISPGYKRVGFFTGGGYTNFVLDLYRRLFGNIPFEIFVFDNNQLRWGEVLNNGVAIRSPEDIPSLDLDLVLISNFVFSEVIYSSLTERFPNENIKKLHYDNDVPWLF